MSWCKWIFFSAMEPSTFSPAHVFPFQKFNITQNEELAFHSLLRWKIFILLILTTSHIPFSLKGWENVLFELGRDRVNHAYSSVLCCVLVSACWPAGTSFAHPSASPHYWSFSRQVAVSISSFPPLFIHKYDTTSGGFVGGLGQNNMAQWVASAVLSP